MNGYAICVLAGNKLVRLPEAPESPSIADLLDPSKYAYFEGEEVFAAPVRYTEGPKMVKIAQFSNGALFREAHTGRYYTEVSGTLTKGINSECVHALLEAFESLAVSKVVAALAVIH